MATARRHWFRVADSVAREAWSNDVAATFLRLCGMLNTRWARDGLDAVEACSIVLRPADLMACTGSQSLARARRIVNELAAHISLTVDEQGANTRLEWPKWSEFQKIDSPKFASNRPKKARKLPPPPPPPQDAPARREEEAAPPPAAPGAGSLARVSKASRKKPETPVPDRLTSPDRQRVMAWAASQSPPISDHALGYAWKAYTAKARARQYRYADHAQAFMNALGASGEAWALKGYEPPSKPGGGRYRSAEDVLADARAKAAADDARSRESEPEDPVAVAALIDRSLRPPLALVRPAPAAAEAETA